MEKLINSGAIVQLQMDTKLLRDIGLTNNEIAIYLALLQAGSSKAGSLRGEVMLHRSRVYEALASLMEKGLATYVIKNKVKFFEAAAPDRLLGYVEEERTRLSEKGVELRAMLPEFGRLISPLKPHAEAHVLYGREGFKTMRNDVLKHARDILLLGAKGREFSAIKYYFPHFDRERVKKGIKWKILVDYDVRLMKEFKGMALSEVRTLPKGYSSPAVINIYADRVINVVWKGNEPICFMIINKDIADSYRKWFQLLWMGSN